MEVVELENNRFDNLTCGTVSILRNHYDLGESAKETKKKMAQVLQTGVNDLNCYCPGCFMQLRGAAKRVNIKTHYALEEILWAFGDDYPVALEERAAKQTGLFIEKVKAASAGKKG